MLMNTFKSILAVWALLLLPVLFVACADDKDEMTVPQENGIPGQEVGIRQLSLKLPRLGRLEILFSKVNCRIHLKGKDDNVTYPVNTFLSADTDSLLIEAEDPILSELPHQQYRLNYVTFSRKDLTSKAEADDTLIAQDTIYLGARLSIEDPNNIAFRSSFNLKADCIGTGSKDDPIAIACGQDFMTNIVNAMTNCNDLSGICFDLTENINFQLLDITSGKGWEPAGHNNINGGSTDFNGTLDGQGNRIDNLFCHTSDGYGGLFYSLGSEACIHDIQFHYVQLDGKDYLGTVACYANRDSRLENISVEGFISGKNNIGGLVGKGSPIVIRCISSVTLSSDTKSSNIGGMIGYSEGATFTDCLRNGQIKALSSSNVGGFIGYSKEGNLDRCYVCGKIEGKDQTGGICGNSDDLHITDCQVGATIAYGSYAYPWQAFTEAKVTEISIDIHGNNKVGGFLGSGNLTLNGANAFKYSNTSTPSLTATNYAGGLAGMIMGANIPRGTTFTSKPYIKANNYVGGLIGTYDSTNGLEGSFENAGTIKGSTNVGGLFGHCKKINNGSYTNTARVEGNSRVGGIAGEMGTCENVTIVNDGDVIATSDYVGGLFGILSGYMSLRNESRVSSSTGSMKLEGANHIGGMVGRFDNGNNTAGFIPPCYGSIIGRSNVGGLFGSIGFSDVETNIDLFKSVSPGQVTITSTSGSNVGGAIGLLQVDSRRENVFYVNVSGVRQLRGSITANGGSVGGIVGRAENYHCLSLRFNDCHNYMTLTSTSSSNVDGYGGIIGMRDEKGFEIKVTRSVNHGNISGPFISAAGGIVGQQLENVYIDQCYNDGTIDATSAVGGIAGRVTDYTTVTNCFNMGFVPWASGKSLLAGIVGQKEDKSKKHILIENCYNVGATGWGIIGGEDDDNVDCRNCYYLNTASDGDMKGSGSHAKSADEMRRKSTYAGFSTDVWTFSGDGYSAPVLRNVPTPSSYPLH